MLSGLAVNFEVTAVNSTTIQVVAGTNERQVSLAIEGQYRYITATIQRAHPGGAAGSYDLYATALANDLTSGEPAGDDYSFALAIVPGGTVPSGVAIYRLMRRILWNGAGITNVVGLKAEGVNTVSSLGDDVLSAFVTGDVNPRFYINRNGVLLWGDGTDPGDINLQRASAGALSCSGSLAVVQNLTVLNAGASATMTLVAAAGAEAVINLTAGAGQRALISFLDGAALPWAMFKETDNSFQLFSSGPPGSVLGITLAGNFYFKPGSSAGLSMGYNFGSAQPYFLQIAGSFNAVGTVYSGGVALTSDRRVKNEIEALTAADAHAAVMRLRPVSYVHSRHGNGARQFGLIAQDVEPVIPEAVTDVPDAHPDVIDDGQSIKALDYTHVLAHLIGAIQHQAALANG